MTGGSSLIIGSKTEGVSVLAGGSLSSAREATLSRQGTETGGVLQQTKSQTPANHHSTSTGATSRQSELRWTWILGALMGVWSLGVVLL